MIQELNLSPTGYVIVLVVLAWGFYQLVKIPSQIDTENTVNDSKNTVETPEYLGRYGRVIQMQGRE